VEEITKAATAPNVLNVAIPMNLPVSQVLPKINELVEERQRQRLNELGLDPKAFTKDEYRQMAASDLGAFSKAAFDHVWIASIEETGRQDWYEPLPRRRMVRN
jgi:hypothetical protein